MARATWLLSLTTALGVAAAAWLYQDNRALRAALAAPPSGRSPASAAPAPSPAPAGDPWLAAARPSPRLLAAPPPPRVPDAPPEESRLERRARRTEEIAALLGRRPGESEEAYRTRIGPLVSAGLALPRQRAAELRKEAERRAGVSPEQARRLDEAFGRVYEQALDYADKAIADGVVSPYGRNVAGWLEVAGGLGGILGDAEAQVGKILTPAQVKALSDSGFEWGEYLGVTAPWEQLHPPPPPPGGG